MADDLVEARLFDVEDLAFQRQDRLEVSIAAELRAAAGRFALDEKDLALGWIPLRTIGEFAGQRAAVQRVLAPREIARLAGRFARARRVDAFLDDAARGARILLKIVAEGFADDLADHAVRFGAAELSLGLPFEFRVGDLHGDDCRETFAQVFAGEVAFGILEHAGLLRIAVEHARQCRSEPG